MINTKSQPATKIGRPLSFDRDAALMRAMHLFWAHGYEATSVADLTVTMGITAPSLYAAYGDKKRLFLEAVDLYCATPVSAAQIIADAATAGDAADQMLHGAAVHFTGDDTPHGCLLAHGAISCSAAAQDVRTALADIRRGTEALLSEKVSKDIVAGTLSDDTDADLLAAYVMTMIQGMASLARDGASRDKLQSLAGAMMHSWPGRDS